MQGWISLYRELLDNPIVCKDTDYFAIWSYLLLQASHKDRPVIFNKEKIILKRGQLIVGRIKIANHFSKLNESKVQRVLKVLESELMIEQQTSNKNRLITILNYNQYQNSEQQNEQPVNNKRTTSEQPVNTNNNNNNKNNVNNETIKPIVVLPYKEIVSYLNQKLSTSYKSSSKKTQSLITARFNEGFLINDFYKVIDNKYNEWDKTDMSKFLRPETLFGNKFEGYLNQKEFNNKTNFTEDGETVIEGRWDKSEIKFDENGVIINGK